MQTVRTQIRSGKTSALIFSKLFDTLIVFPKEFSKKKMILKKNSADEKRQRFKTDCSTFSFQMGVKNKCALLLLILLNLVVFVSIKNTYERRSEKRVIRAF